MLPFRSPRAPPRPTVERVEHVEPATVEYVEHVESATVEKGLNDREHPASCSAGRARLARRDADTVRASSTRPDVRLKQEHERGRGDVVRHARQWDPHRGPADYTPFAATVNADGCALADLCPCASAWKNHGAYVSCVAKAGNAFVAAGLFTPAEKDAATSAAAESTCGKK